MTDWVPNVNMTLVFVHLREIVISFILALPIAINREHQSEAAGMRTFPLVAIACCAFMLVGMQIYQGSDAEARVIYGTIIGISVAYNRYEIALVLSLIGYVIFQFSHCVKPRYCPETEVRSVSATPISWVARRAARSGVAVI